MSFLHNKKGFSLAEMGIALGIGSIILLTVTTANHWLNGMSKSSGRSLVAATIQSEMMNTVRNTSTWQETMNHSSNASQLGCLLDDNLSCKGKGGKISLRTHNGEPFLEKYDSLDITHGFTEEGIPCKGFIATGNDACPFHVDVFWKPICNSDECLKPMAEIKLQFIYRPKSVLGRYAFNASNFTISFLRSSATTSHLQDVCEMSGGEFNDASNECVIEVGTMANQQCPAGFAISGIKANGYVSCIYVPIAGTQPVRFAYCSIDAPNTGVGRAIYLDRDIYVMVTLTYMVTPPEWVKASSTSATNMMGETGTASADIDSGLSFDYNGETCTSSFTKALYNVPIPRKSPWFF